MDLQTAARKYDGVKFHHQGRSAWALDCAGLLIIAAKELGYEYPEMSNYARTPDGKTMMAVMDKHLTRVNRPPQVNDVLLMRFDKHPQHVAIVTDIGIIHSYESVGRVVEHGLDERWINRIVAVYTL